MDLLFIDIETAPASVLVWDLYKPHIGVDQIVRPTSLLCFTAKWADNRGLIFAKSTKQEGPVFDAMVRKAHSVLSQADAVCHYNGLSFDIPRLNAEFLRLGLTPPPPSAQIDLKKVVMSKFGFVSSKLAFIGPELKIGEKVKHDGWPLWIDCLEGETEAWKTMERYNKQDVLLLERLYKKLLPWIDGHPNMGLHLDGDDPKCPNCGSEKVQRRGVQHGATYSYARYHCQKCGRWCRARKSDKTLGGAAALR